jgi:hypothetical protein
MDGRGGFCGFGTIKSTPWGPPLRLAPPLSARWEKGTIRAAVGPCSRWQRVSSVTLSRLCPGISRS